MPGYLPGIGQADKQDDTVDRQHDRILEHAQRKQRQKGISIENGQPVGIKPAVYNELDQKVRSKDPLDGDGSAVKNRTVDDTGEHGVEGKAEEKRTGRIYHIFYDIHGSAEYAAHNRPEQSLDDTVRETGKTDFDVGADGDACDHVEDKSESTHDA